MLVSEAIARAYREAAILGIGVLPNAAEEAEGLHRLNGFLMSLFGAEIGENLQEWMVPSILRTADRATDALHLPFPNNLTDRSQPLELGTSRTDSAYVYQPPQNARLITRVSQPTLIYFPSNPSDGARMSLVDTGSTAVVTLDGNGRLIEGQTTYVANPGDPAREWFYRSDLANWIPLVELTPADQLPLPREFDDLIIAGTALRLTGLDEIQPTSATMMIYERLLKRCQQRYAQKVNMTYGGENLVESQQAYLPGAGWW